MESESSRRPLCVLGPFRGGTSLTTGVLASLGAYPGATFSNPESVYCTFEDARLTEICKRCFNQCQRWRFQLPKPDRVKLLRGWLESAQKECDDSDRIRVVGKHPLLCKLVADVDQAWQQPLYVVVRRSFADVTNSWDRGRNADGSRWWPRSDRRRITRDLIVSRNVAIADKDFVSFDFDQLIKRPQRTVQELAKACQLRTENCDLAVELIQRLDAA